MKFDPNSLGTDKDKFLAAVDMVKRTGAKQFQLRWSDDEEPLVWFAVAVYRNTSEADASLSPLRAVLRLLERVCDGGICMHCNRATGLDPDSLMVMPLNDLICWYQYDPELKTFRRACE